MDDVARPEGVFLVKESMTELPLDFEFELSGLCDRRSSSMTPLKGSANLVTNEGFGFG